MSEILPFSAMLLNFVFGDGLLRPAACAAVQATGSPKSPMYCSVHCSNWEVLPSIHYNSAILSTMDFSRAFHTCWGCSVWMQLGHHLLVCSSQCKASYIAFRKAGKFFVWWKYVPGLPWWGSSQSQCRIITYRSVQPVMLTVVWHFGRVRHLGARHPPEVLALSWAFGPRKLYCTWDHSTEERLVPGNLTVASPRVFAPHLCIGTDPLDLE